MSDNIEECPFCLSENVYYHWHRTADVVGIGCLGCGAIGPRARNREEATELWNNHVIHVERSDVGWRNGAMLVLDELTGDGNELKAPHLRIRELRRKIAELEGKVKGD